MVKKLLAQRAKTDHLTPWHRFSGRKAKPLPEHGKELKELVAKEPDLTYKKTRHVTEQNWLNIAKVRRRWKRAQGGIEPPW